MRKDGENMGKQQKYMPYPVFRISGFGKDQRYGKQRKTGESFGIYHAVGGVPSAAEMCGNSRGCAGRTVAEASC